MDKAPSMEGRFMSMVLSPKSGKGGGPKHAPHAENQAKPAVAKPAANSNK
jgi:hypothetical protein